MNLLKILPEPLLELRLSRELTRIIKRGHPWVFADALRRLPPATPGVPAILLDAKKGRPIAVGFYDPGSPLAFRVCDTNPERRLDNNWATQQFDQALALRRLFARPDTTGFRLFNGEGDGLPGLVCDVYGDTAVLQLDGPAPQHFWHAEGVARWIAERLPVTTVYLKTQSRNMGKGRALVGSQPPAEVAFTENGVRFTTDIINGQKTGFFLDQRDNRQLIRQVAQGRRTLNLFGYTGGFSVYAGLGGASHVTTVDSAGPALNNAVDNWRHNGLPPLHHTEKADAFAFLDDAARKGRLWELVVVDPPSFAASAEQVDKAGRAYQRLFAAAAAVTRPGHLLAVASCSSHIALPQFLSICEESISAARRRATVLAIKGQPADHPTPLPFSEFRYLKFVLMRVD